MAGMTVARRGAWLMLLVLLAQAPLAGCAAPGRPSPEPTSVAPTVHPSGAPQVDPLVPYRFLGELPAPTEAVMVPAASAEQGLSMPWKFLGFTGGGDTINVVYVAGDNDCVKPVGFYVHRSGDDVIVEAVSQQAPGRTACADMLALRRATVGLPTAISGGVRLVHAATDPEWSSQNYFPP